jgi:glyoxylase-like metal-dependent hydrolase (beta-lactamase superfamily II)
MFYKIRTACAVALLLTAAVASAQSGQRRESSGEGSGVNALTPAMVKTGLFVISGGGCNSLLRLSSNGFIIVDGKLPGNYEAILALAKKLSYSEQPIRILINTDYHENHTGNNAKFLEDGAAILAHENVKNHLAGYTPRGGKVTPPTRTYDHDFTIKLGGIEARLLHFGNAHTNGDTVVYFPNLKVVAVGDLFAAAPDPDFSAGGSLVGWGPVLAQILKLDFDVVVPGTGPMVARADLEAFKTKVDTLVARATVLVRKGVPKSQLMAQLKTDDLSWRLSFTGDRLDRLYAELSQTR